MWKLLDMIEVVSITEDMMKLGNTQVHLLSFFRNVAFVRNTQCPVHHNKMVYQKGVIEL